MAALTHLDLTYVQYTLDSHVSFLLAHVTLLPFVTLSAYAALVYFNRDAVILNAFAGQLANEGLNLVLKRLFRIRRQTIGNGYGMPSSHAQFAAYTATFILLHQYTRLGRVDLQAWCACAVALLVAYSRHHLSYHTTNQIIVGWAIGALFAVFYFNLTEVSCGLRVRRKSLLGKLCGMLRHTRLFIVHTLSLNDPTLSIRRS